MNKEQFIFWFKGFTKAANEEGPTLKQWETIVSELDKIKDCPDYGSPIDGGVVLTTSSGSSGIIIATPGYGSITYNPSTSTAYVNSQSGSWHYTSTLPQQPTTGSNQLELDLK
jgi:hypothetical protein